MKRIMQESAYGSPTHTGLNPILALAVASSDAQLAAPLPDPEGLVKPVPDFCKHIQYFADADPSMQQYLLEPAIPAGSLAVLDAHDPAAVYQTQLLADALRYLTLQMTGSKASGHPGGFASCAEAHAALIMLGHKNMLTDVGHHAPGFYSALFLDRSLEKMGIYTVQDLCAQFRECHGLLGHLSGQVPGVLAPAGPLGQGQHFAMAGALLHPGVLFPFTLGDGGMGEPYTMSSMVHFHTAFPQVSNFLPVLVWNGYSQEHHSMVSTKSNSEMLSYWLGNGFDKVILVDAKDFDDANQASAYVDSTAFSKQARLAFTEAVLAGMKKATQAALSGKLTVFIIKQLKGAGVHAHGAKSHNLLPNDKLDSAHIAYALKNLALSIPAWQLLRNLCERAAGGPAAEVVVTEHQRVLPELDALCLEEYPVCLDLQVATTAMGKLVGKVGQVDANFIVSSADGNEATGMANINQVLKIVHPALDELYHQAPNGRVYGPLSEDACAGLAAGLALFGGRSLWCSYESFAINGLPVWQTVTQAISELRRSSPSAIALFTASALEQGRNGWTHQRPEIEGYLAAMMRNGNVFLLFPVDANSIQACYKWALGTYNKSVLITASKSALPVRTTFQQARQGLVDGAMLLHASTVMAKLVPDRPPKTLVFAVVGDMILLSVYAATATLEQLGVQVKIVSVLNPRRLYRPCDVAWEGCANADSGFLDDAGFARLFDGDALLGVTSGAGAVLEPVMLRSQSKRDLLAWQRGQTTANTGQLLELNGLDAEKLVARAMALLN